MSNVTIYHNPNCGTSRNVLSIIKAVGIEPEVIFYLETPPDEAKLRQLIDEMGGAVRDVLRKNVEPFERLNLADKSISDDQIIAYMLQEPLLINRPIVVTEFGTKLCRPSETVLEILSEKLTRQFKKEDGEVVNAND